MEQLYGRLAALLAVKSLVTLALTAGFVCLAAGRCPAVIFSRCFSW